MSDQSERLHLEGLDEATERERWEEHYGPPPALSRAEAEKAITAVLAEHEYTATFLGAAGACSCGREWPSNRDTHRAHVASVLADLMADGPTLSDAWDEGHHTPRLRHSAGIEWVYSDAPNPYRVSDTEGDR